MAPSDFCVCIFNLYTVPVPSNILPTIFDLPLYRSVAILSYMYVHVHVMFQHSPPLVQPLVMMTFVLQEGRSPLYVAILRGDLQVVKALIEKRADVNRANMVGEPFI